MKRKVFTFSNSKKNVKLEKEILFDQIYTQYWEPLNRTALHMLKDEQESEDIVQETFVRLWENWDTLHLNNIKGWLFTTSYHIVLKNLKKQKQINNIQAENIQPVFSSDADEKIQLSQLQNQIDNCVNKLPEKCKVVYQMSRGQYLSIKNIAAELNISPKTVEYHVSTALKRIRESISTLIVFLLFLY